MRSRENSAPTTTKTAGYILWSQRKVVETKQEAWHDRTTYECPFVVEANTERIMRAIYSRFTSRGSIIGSSYGAASVSGVSIDTTNKTVTFSIAVGIGD